MKTSRNARGDHVALPLLAVAVHVADEVHGAALPGTADHLGDRGLEAEVVVGDGKLDSAQAAGTQLTQEGGPAGFGLRLGDLDADHLAPAGLVHSEGDHQRLGVDVASIPDLEVLGVEPQVGVGALQWAGAEGFDLAVELAADPRDLVLGHLDPELGDQVVDLAGRDAVHVGLHDHAQQRLLASLAGLQEGWEVALPGALSGHRQLDLADPGRPGPWAVAVSVGRACLADLSFAGADLAGDLGLHDLGGNHRHALAQEVGVLLDQGLGYDPGARHALALGHRGASFRQSTCRSTDESGARGGRNFVPVPTWRLHHF